MGSSSSNGEEGTAKRDTKVDGVRLGKKNGGWEGTLRVCVHVHACMKEIGMLMHVGLELLPASSIH